MNILIADKSSTARQAIVDALARLDAIAVQGVVSDLRAAVRSLCQRPPDVVITGIELADASGLDLIEAARQLAPASHIVVVAASPVPEAWLGRLENTAVRFVASEPSLHELCAVVTALARPAPDGAPDDELRLLGRISAGVAHDLNNYLGAAAAVLAVLATTTADPELFARARGSIDQALRLTRSLTSYVRGSPPQFEAVDLGALVARTLALIAPVIPPAIAVRVDIAAHLVPIHGAVAELEQLVLNLVLNAADAMPDGGELRVRVRPTGGGWVYLEVADTGPGMPAAVQVTGDARTPSTKPGRRHGLGLGIVRRVIEHHRGSLKLAPRIDPPGTIVCALLPIEGA
ncbi:MAG TPA: ATP-binding protein [Kofleriaceae bacterium]